MPVVDRSFLKDLKNMDSRLGTKFNGEHFVVTYNRGYGQPVNIYRVKAEDGSFRQPDKRDLAVIKGGDLAEGDSLDARLKKTAYASEKIREAERKRVQDEIRGGAKGNSTFRRIAQ
jgi:hypothetical protein